MCIRDSSGLSLRKGTNLYSEKLLVLPYGAQVDYLYTPENSTMTVGRRSGAMIAVSYQGAKGFVFSGYTSTIAPPREDESVTDYAKRISKPDFVVSASEKPHPKGPNFGKTVTLTMPITSWETTLPIAQKLFDLPSFNLDLVDAKKMVQILSLIHI